MAEFVITTVDGAAKEPFTVRGRGTITIERESISLTAQIDRSETSLDLRLSGDGKIRFSNKSTLKLSGGVDFDALREKLLFSTRAELKLPKGSTFSIETSGKRVGVKVKIKL